MPEELNSSGSVKGNGVWSINGNTFQGTTHDLFPVTNFYSYRTTCDAATKKLTGTWVMEAAIVIEEKEHDQEIKFCGRFHVSGSLKGPLFSFCLC